MTLRRRRISCATRAVAAIERASVTFRTLHPPRRSWTQGAAPAATLDDLVTISVARLRWAERGRR